MGAASFGYVAARSPADVLAALADGETAVLAGGQSLIPRLTSQGIRPRRVVDINGVAEFESISESGGVLRVGPLVRHRHFESDAVGGPLGDLLRRVVRHIGHPPIRARGTMLGSLAYAHPAAEWPVVATVLNARFDLAGPGGTRTVPATAFFTGPLATVRRADELLAEVRLPVLPEHTGAGFAEDRQPHATYADAAVVAAITTADGVVTRAAIGLVNAGPCPSRAHEAEELLVGGPLSDAAIAAAADAAAARDARLHRPAAGLAPRRHRTVRLLTRRALTQAREGV